MLFIDRDRGPVELDFRSDRVASFIGRHHHAIRARLEGDDKALEPFVNKRVRISGQRYRPETDPQVLVDLYYGGELDYQDPYDTGFLHEGEAERGDDGGE